MKSDWEGILYHGTNKDFKTFEQAPLTRFDWALPKGEHPAGYYFTPRRQEAEHYATGSATKKGSPLVKEVTLDIKNPYFAKPEEFGFYVTKADQARLERLGYDGVVKITEYQDGTKETFQVVVFKSSQITTIATYRVPGRAKAIKRIAKHKTVKQAKATFMGVGSSR